MALARSLAGSLVKPLASAITGASRGLPLDSVTSAVLAFSFRKLRTAYTGPLAKLRRASDDAEADVDPDSARVLSLDSPVTITSGTSSATMLGEFVAASGYTDVDALGAADDAFIAAWYEQSGHASAADFTQASASLQPQMVASGAVIQLNGRPVLSQPTGGGGLEFLTLTSWSTRPSSASAVQVAMYDGLDPAVVFATDSATVFAGVLTSGSTNTTISLAAGTGIEWRGDLTTIGTEGAGLTRGDLYAALADGVLHVLAAVGISFTDARWDDLRTEYSAGSTEKGPDRVGELIIVTDDAERGGLESNAQTFWGTP